MSNAINGVSGYGGLTIYDTQYPGTNVINPAVVNPYAVLTIPAYWRAINFLANNLTSFPRSIRQEGKRLDVPHKLDRFLKRKPNGYQNAFSFWSTLFFHWKHYGMGIARIKRVANSNEIDSLHNCLPENIIPFRFDDKQYYFDRSATTEAEQIVFASDIIHLSSLSYDGIAGYNPVWTLRETFSRAMMIDRYQTRFLMKGSVIRGCISIPNAIAGDKATDEQIGAIVNQIKTYFSGNDADRDLIVLSGGAEIKNAGMTPKDSELSWQASYTIKQIGQITGVDPYFLFDNSDGKYNGNAELAWDAVCRDVFYNDIEQASAELSSKLLSEADQAGGLCVHLDLSAKIKGNALVNSQTAIAEVNGGVRTRNEGRAELGLPEDSDPESNKLKVLGDTTVNQPKQIAAPVPVRSSSENVPALRLSALRPILADAANRVDAKFEKAFSKQADKPEDQRLQWANRFSAEQKRYAAEALAPIASLYAEIAGAALPVDDIAEQYANQIMHRAMNEDAKTLQQLLEAHTNG